MAGNFNRDFRILFQEVDHFIQFNIRLLLKCGLYQNQNRYFSWANSHSHFDRRHVNIFYSGDGVFINYLNTVNSIQVTFSRSIENIPT